MHQANVFTNLRSKRKGLNPVRKAPSNVAEL